MKVTAEVLSGKKILLVGAAGMLGQHLSCLLVKTGAELVISDVTEIADRAPGKVEVIRLDITNETAVRQAVAEIRPDWIINSAAYTAVDEAEVKVNLAFEVNAYGPANIARALRDFGGRMVHISSDYVFGDDDSHALSRIHYLESDRFSPCGIYGQSKRAGDELVSSAIPERGLIVRTSWLHGIYGPNFVDTILRVAREREEIRVVNDQFGSPTWAGWLADTIIRLIALECSGTVHASSNGEVSWYDFAAEIVRYAGLATRVLPQSTAELGRPAKRPGFSVMSKSRLERLLGEAAPDWRSCVEAHFRARAEK